MFPQNLPPKQGRRKVQKFRSFEIHFLMVQSSKGKVRLSMIKTVFCRIFA